MILQVLSDLHLEHREPEDDKALFDRLQPPRDRKVDLLVLAGDAVAWARRDRLAALLREVSKRWKDVVYVHGNHEHYDFDMTRGPALLKDLGQPGNVEVVFAPRTIAYAGHRLHCGTMWFSEAEVVATGCIDPFNGTWIKKGRLVQFSDFRDIPARNFLPYAWNQAFQALLEAELQEGDVVVSHHLPSPLCAPLRFRAEVDNCFYTCDQTRLIEERSPQLWAHGHTHDDVEVTVSYGMNCPVHHNNTSCPTKPNCKRRPPPKQTRILANPLGYPGEREAQARHFDPHRGIVQLA